MPKPIALDAPCEVCGENKWWDNTESKKSPKAPDFVCANKECAGKDGYKSGRWLPKGGKKVEKKPEGGRITPDDTTPDERGEKVFSWQALTYTYGKLYAAVCKTVVANFPEGTALDQNAIQAGVATLLIQGEKAHIPLLHPRKKEPVPPFEQDTSPAKPKKVVNEGVEGDDWEPDWP